MDHSSTTPLDVHTPARWDAASRGYAERVAPVLMGRFASELVDRLDIQPDMKVLEVGAGSGALTESLSRRAGSVCATDFAPKMIAVLRERLERAGATNVACEVMDGQALTFEDGTFDRAACSFALMLFPNRRKGFSELRRVLRPHGRALVTGWTQPDRFEMFGLFLDVMERAFPDLPLPPGPPAVFSLADPATFKAEMEAGGFNEVEVDFVSRELEIPDAEGVWSFLTAGAPPAQVLLDRIGPSGAERLRETLSLVVDERFGGGPVRLRNVATVGVGTAN